MPSEKVLICGAGVAGSIAAFWLAKFDYDVTVIERSKAEQKMGQGIEIEEPALKVVKEMGIFDTLKSRKTSETGFNLVDQHARSHAIFEAGAFSPTGELELMRGDLTEVLYQSADKFSNVKYHFETSVQSLRQTEDKVIIDLEKRSNKSTWTDEFDFVIGADGVKSRTRKLIMGSPEKLDCFKSVGVCCAYFDIPKEDQDSPYSRVCNFPNRRIVWMRPVSDESPRTSIYLIWARDDDPALRRANAAGDRLKQKEAYAELYSGLRWETPRVIEQMMKTDNFYSDDLVQVKLPKWSQNRVVLLGDAAWAPTPLTGQGNQLAIIGGWVLAQEMSRNRSPAAFEAYEGRLRSYVESCQQIPLWGYAPFIFNPKTAWGIWVLQSIMSIVCWAVHIIMKTRIVSWLPEGKHDDFDMEFEEIRQK